MTEPIYNTDFYYVRTDINEFLREQSELPKDAALPTQRVLPKHPAGRRRGCAMKSDNKTIQATSAQAHGEAADNRLLRKKLREKDFH